MIDLTEAIGMEVDNERVDDEEEGDEVKNDKDIEMLERLHLDDDDEGNIEPSDSVVYLDNLIVMTRHMIQIIPIMMITSNTCNTMLFCNRVCLFI